MSVATVAGRAASPSAAMTIHTYRPGARPTASRSVRVRPVARVPRCTQTTVPVAARPLRSLTAARAVAQPGALGLSCCEGETQLQVADQSDCCGGFYAARIYGGSEVPLGRG